MSTLLLKKLNHKNQNIIVISPPDEFKAETDAIKKTGTKITVLTLKGISEVKQVGFILSFVQTKNEVEKIISSIFDKLETDALVWFAYSKGSSKKYKAEINRDRGWEALGKKGFEAVRAVAIDLDWSGIRFRQVTFIKTMKRNSSLSMTTAGKTRTDKK